MGSPNQPIPEGHDHLIPHLVCSNCTEAIEFYKKAFGAVELRRMPAPDGKRVMHAAMQLGKSMFFLADDFPEFCGGHSRSPLGLKGTPVTIHRYVDDVDAAIKRAQDAGANVTMPATDMFWGDRYGIVVDPSGHNWSMATHIKDMTPEEMHKGMMEACGAAVK